MRTKKRKVGDRIFYENHKGEIETCLIKEIRQESSRQDMHGKPLKDDGIFKYDVYKTGAYSSIEDYNCLSDNDPRVKEFCKGRKLISLSFANDLRTWLAEHGCHEGDTDVAQILRDIAEEFE